MNYRRLGRSGLKLSEISFGAWVNFGAPGAEGAARACMTAAYDGGVNFFDNAEAYAGGRAETEMGKIFKETGWQRESLVVSTKIFWGGKGPNDTGLSHKHIVEGVNAALRRLQLDYVDLLFCHRPDPDTPIEETVRAMDLVVRRGQAFYWGTSEWGLDEILKAIQIARELHLTPPVMEQPQYNMFHRDRFELEYAQLFEEQGFGTTIWSPLSSGLLSGKYNDGVPPGSRLARPDYAWLKEDVLQPARIDKVKRLAPIARELGCTVAQLAITWCLCNPNVSTVITGATRPEQVAENLAAAKVKEQLSPELLARIERVLDNKPTLPSYE